MLSDEALAIVRQEYGASATCWDREFADSRWREPDSNQELVAEVKFLPWTDDNLLLQVVYEGRREDKPPADVRRPIPYPQPE